MIQKVEDYCLRTRQPDTVGNDEMDDSECIIVSCRAGFIMLNKQTMSC